MFREHQRWLAAHSARKSPSKASVEERRILMSVDKVDALLVEELAEATRASDVDPTAPAQHAHFEIQASQLAADVAQIVEASEDEIKAMLKAASDVPGQHFRTPHVQGVQDVAYADRPPAASGHRPPCDRRRVLVYLRSHR
jgi:hypothetical protein